MTFDPDKMGGVVTFDPGWGEVLQPLTLARRRGGVVTFDPGWGGGVVTFDPGQNEVL